MGFSQSPSPPHLYSQALQLKLYQAFIFSIPILFSIVLFLLFYLFYLKKRASSFSSHPPSMLPTSSNQATPIFLASACEVGLKGDLNDKLLKIVFDEDIRARDQLSCCVCLGEFETKEELVQVPSCKHLFHAECIRHWLRSNTTCPLCRCSVVAADHTSTKLIVHLPSPQLNNSTILLDQQQQQQIRELQVSNATTTAAAVGSNVPIGGSSSSSRISNTILLDQQQQQQQQQQIRELQVSNTTTTTAVGSNVPNGGSSSSSRISNTTNACLMVSHEMERLENQGSVILHIQDQQ